MDKYGRTIVYCNIGIYVFGQILDYKFILLNLLLFKTLLTQLYKLLHGCETRKFTKRITQSIQAFINKCPRRICKFYWPTTLNNDDLWELTKQHLVDTVIKWRKRGWIGHSLEDTIRHNRKSPGTGPRKETRQGRPKDTCRRTILKEAERSKKSWRKIKDLARNEVSW